MKPVPFDRWELVMWTCFCSAAVLNLVTADEVSGRILGLVALLLVLAFLGSSVHVHRRRPDFLTQRVATELIWLFVAAVVYFTVIAVSADQLGERLVNVLVALGCVAAVVSERTREIPMGTLRAIGSGGRFDQTTAAGRERLDLVVRIAAAVGIVAMIALMIAGSRWGLFGLVLIGGGILGWEGMRMLAKRRKLGYYALEEDD